MKTVPSWTVLTLCLSALAVTPALADLDDSLAMADLAAGEKIFKRCAACHTINQGGQKKIGPNLYGIVGNPVAAADSFKYSAALTIYGGDWSVERLDAFLTKPKAEVKGTRMGFSGLKNAVDRINLIAFLDSNSDAPIASAQDQANTTPEEVFEEPEYGLLIETAGVDNTYYTCSACHSEMIVAQQGLTRDGWDELIEWMVEEQGMSELDEPDLNEILDYLAANYNIDRPNFPNHQDRTLRQVVED